VKAGLDCINNIVISDDSLVVDLIVTKKYAAVPALTIVIAPLIAATAQGKLAAAITRTEFAEITA
jgi:hypothetical protein